MKRVLTTLLLLITLSSFANRAIWQSVERVPDAAKQVIHPDKYLVFNVNTQGIRSFLWDLSDKPELGKVISLPAPDGSMKSFSVWEAPMFEPGLAAKFPDIKTFTAVSLDNKYVTAKLDYTVMGFHAMIFDGSDTYFIDPYSNPGDDYYLCYYKKDIRRSVDIDVCAAKPHTDIEALELHDANTAKKRGPAQYKQFGASRYTYRLALACTGEYSVAVAGTSTPSKAISLSAMTTSMNRVNGVYEREVGVHMNLIANNDLIIYLDGSTDPYDNTDGYTMKTQNQNNINTVIGFLNYDIGHGFSTGVGGVAELGVVCGVQKAHGVTGRPNPVGDGFDIDYVVHEMGHQFDATHSFNLNEPLNGSCSGNATSTSAYEPGGGSTIMAYAGICSKGNNVQQNSDDYFHAKSVDQITEFLISTGATCAVTSFSGNTPPVLSPLGQSYNIPYKTPFELIAPGVTDNDHDILNYCWEEWDLGDFGKTFANTSQYGPIFRSFKPSESGTRIFPTLDSLRKDVKNYVGEKLPEVARELKFKLTVRDMLNGFGSFDMSDDVVTLNVTGNSGPFMVTYPNWNLDYLQGGTNVTITWDVANTTSAPVNCNKVDILLSTDNASTFPFTLAANTDNDGSETVFIPSNIYSAACRVKVKAVGNVFFDMSNQYFSIFPWPANVASQTKETGVSVYPVPAKDVLHVEAENAVNSNVEVINALGVQVYKGLMTGHITINTQSWAAGMYCVKITDTASGLSILKKAVIE